MRFGLLSPGSPPLPPWLSPGVFWPSSVLLVPPSGYLVLSATVRLSYLWYGVSCLIGSCLHSASWQQRLRPCVGLCPLHHVVGVVPVPLAPSLRQLPSCDPEYPSDTAKAAHARLLGLCCFLPPVLLPSRASALSFLAGLRLSPPPRALVLLGSVCPPCGPWSWLVLVAPPSLWCWFFLLAWPVFWLGLFGLFGFVVLFVLGWSLCFVFCCWWLLLLSYWTGTLAYLLSPAQLRLLSQVDLSVCPQTEQVHLCC